MTNYFRNARNLIESPIKPGGIALVKILALSFYIAKWMTIIKYSDDFLYYFVSRIVFSDFAKEHNVLFRRVPTSCWLYVFCFYIFFSFRDKKKSLVLNTHLKFVAVNDRLWCFFKIFLNISGFLGKPYEIIQLSLKIYGLFLAPLVGHVIASYMKLLNNMTEFFLLILNIIIKTQSLFFKWKK